MLLYKQISWMPHSYHVYDGDKRIGLVSYQKVKINGKIDRIIWTAHNSNFFTLPGDYSSRRAAAEAIPKGPVHQPIEAFSGRYGPSPERQGLKIS